MLKIKCARCKAKIMKYHKIGYGRVLRCYFQRIKENYGLEKEKELQCPSCGNAIGERRRGHYRMYQKEFTGSGKKIRK